ncbi:MAG: hypothetical protein K2Q09_09440, partial [Phycisphaerales bacterium]|nr:hypothetical protein [Phycisphaerales bacterium]
DINGDPGFPGSAIRSRYWLAAKATALGGGLYRYEYAVYNHNSDRSAGAFTAPLPVGAALSDVSFHAPQWHSGEPYSNAPWGIARSSTGVTFSTEAYGVNPNANALRWANTFNFGFTTDASPTTGAVSLDLFKPGAPGAPSTVAVAGVPVPATPAQCGPADMGRQGGLAGQDGQLDNNDFVVMINFFFANDGRADLGQQGGLVGADGQFDNNDFIVFINLFFAGC